jgi:hypothetical protein
MRVSIVQKPEVQVSLTSDEALACLGGDWTPIERAIRTALKGEVKKHSEGRVYRNMNHTKPISDPCPYCDKVEFGGNQGRSVHIKAHIRRGDQLNAVQ